MHIAAFVWTIALSVGSIATGYAYFVTVCSHAHSLLPPWDGDAIACFPRFQKWYRIFIYFLGYAGASYRSAVNKSISTQEGTRVSDNGFINNVEEAAKAAEAKK
jgi:hypothetical protein